MAQVLSNISNIIIPVIIFYIIAYGVISKSNVYEDFVRGAKEGLKTVAGILPTLVALMIAVGVLRASGFLTFLSDICKPLMEYFHFPAELVPLTFIKMFSSSAATGLVLDIFKNYGTDSFIGLVTSIMMSCTDIVVIYRRNEEYLQNTGFGVCPYFFPFAGWSESANYVKAMANRMLKRLE